MREKDVILVDATGVPTGTATNPFVVAAPAAGDDVNLISVSGAAITLGQKPMATSLPVVISSDQSNLPSNLTAVGGSAIAIGQALMAASLPVAFASNQTALPISSSTDYAQGSTTAGQVGPLVQASVTTSAPSYTTAQTSPLSMNTSGMLRVSMNAQSTAITSVAINNTTIANTATSGASASFLYAWDIADNTRSLAVAGAAQSRAFTATDKALETRGNIIAIGGSALALGQAAMAGSIPVVLASNQASVPVAATLQASSGTDIGKLTANQSVNVAQLGGSANSFTTGSTTGKIPAAIFDSVGNALNTLQPGSILPATGFSLSVNSLLYGFRSGVGNQSMSINAQNASFATGDLALEVRANLTAVGAIAVPAANAGAQWVNTEGTKATYSAAVTGLAIAAAATDFFLINGSGTKTIRVTKITVSGVATAAGATSIQLLKRSTANSGGTSTAPTVVPHDSTDAAGTAAVLAYTVSPTPGTLVGMVRAIRPTFTTAAGAIPEVPFTMDFGVRNEKDIVLRGTAQGLALNLNAATVAGLTVDIDITWTEE